jgi:hypothetical protein
MAHGSGGHGNGFCPAGAERNAGVLAVKALLWISPKNHPDYARGPRAVGRERVSLEVHF